MAVTLNHDLLRTHPFLKLRLAHAAIGSYPIRSRSTLSVNRILMVFEDSGSDASFIHDLASGELLQMQPESVYFVPCHHEIDINLTDSLLFVSLQFSLDLFYGFDVFKNYGKCVRTHNPGLISEAKSLFERQTDAQTLCRVNSIIFNICVPLLADCPSMNPKERLISRRYETILAFVQNSGDASTTVAMLADMLSMRQDVFSRRFTRDMRITPKEFIDNAIVRKASEMLLASDASVNDVSQCLNFSSECYFSRFFKKHTGIPPRQFRRINGGS